MGEAEEGGIGVKAVGLVSTEGLELVGRMKRVSGLWVRRKMQ